MPRLFLGKMRHGEKVCERARSSSFDIAMLRALEVAEPIQEGSHEASSIQGRGSGPTAGGTSSDPFSSTDETLNTGSSSARLFRLPSLRSSSPASIPDHEGVYGGTGTGSERLVRKTLPRAEILKLKKSSSLPEQEAGRTRTTGAGSTTEKSGGTFSSSFKHPNDEDLSWRGSSDRRPSGTASSSLVGPGAGNLMASASGTSLSGISTPHTSRRPSIGGTIGENTMIVSSRSLEQVGGKSACPRDRWCRQVGRCVLAIVGYVGRWLVGRVSGWVDVRKGWVGRRDLVGGWV